jgi:hypothetical protein
MDNFHRIWIYGLIVLLLVMCCKGCASFGGKPPPKNPVDTTLNVLKKYCDFHTIKFKDDIEKPMLDEVTCFSKLKQFYGIP